jgi:hypothetical protein
VRNDHGAGFAEVFVAPGVIEMPVCVEDEANGLVADSGNRGENLGGEWRELVVDEERGVISDRKADGRLAAYRRQERAASCAPARCRSSSARQPLPL